MMKKHILLDIVALSLNDMLNLGPETSAGLLHHLPIYGDALLLDEVMRDALVV